MEQTMGSYHSPMSDPRLPIVIKKLPGGYRLQFNDGKSSLMVYGTGADIAQAAGSLSSEEAKALAEEVLRTLTNAWGGHPA
jgi:hypothetical protein